MASTMRQLPPAAALGGEVVAKAGLEASTCKEEDVWEVMMAWSVNHFQASIQLYSTYYYPKINNQAEP